jgi:hypothetical protein
MKADELLTLLQEQGFQPHHAAGIVGNAQQESSLNPTAVNTKSGAFGLGQWLGSRKTQLYNFAKQNNMSASDPRLQVAFIKHEVDNDEASAGAALANTKTPAEAAVVFSNRYERAGKDERNNANRINVANQVMNTIIKPANASEKSYIPTREEFMAMRRNPAPKAPVIQNSDKGYIPTREEFMQMKQGLDANIEKGADAVLNLDPSKLVDKAKPVVDQFATPVHQGMEHVVSSVPDQMLSNELAAYRRGPAAYKRWQEVQKMSPMHKAMISAGHETSNLIKGVNTLGYNLAGMSADKWNQEHPSLVGPEFAQSMMAKTNAIEDQQPEDTKLYQEFKDSQGWPGAFGAMLPYMVTGELLGKPFAKAGGKIVGTLAEAPSAAIRTGKAASESIVDKLAASNSTPLKNIFGKVQAEITNPWKEKAIAESAKPTVTNPYLAGRGGELVGNTLLGATEGGLNPENDVRSGAISSAFGTLAGQWLKPGLVRPPNFRENNPVEQAAIKWYQSKGGRTLPGLERGSKALQTFERTLSSDTTYADPLHRIMEANNIVNNNIAAESMGMKRTASQAFTPEHLMDHKQALGKEYDALEAGTIANFTPLDKRNLVTHANKLTMDQTQAGKVLASDVKDYLRQIDQLTPQRNPLTGQIQAMNITGSDFKDLRSRLQSDITGAFQQGNRQRADALKPILKTVDDAVERGVEKKGGTAGVAQWKDLNERYAITNLVLDNGLSVTGQLDPAKLYQHLENNDIRRIVLGEGGRVKDLHKLAQVEYMTKHQAGPDISGLTQNNMFNRTASSPMEKMLMSQYAGLPGFNLASNGLLKIYASDRWSPARHGALHMSGKNFGNPVMYTRADEQANKRHVKYGEAAISAATYIPKKLRGMYDWVEEKLSGE